MVTYHLMHMGSIKKPTNITRLDLQMPQEVTVRELLSYLWERGNVIGRREDYEGDPFEYLHVIVNGASARNLQGSETILKDGDNVVLLIPLVGGA